MGQGYSGSRELARGLPGLGGQYAGITCASASITIGEESLACVFGAGGRAATATKRLKDIEIGQEAGIRTRTVRFSTLCVNSQ
jgi:hypothetical protein